MKTPNSKNDDAGELSTSNGLPYNFKGLVKNKTPGAPRAKVTVGYSEALDYGAIKVSVTVSLECDQTDEMVEEAGRVGYYKARELVDDGWAVLRAQGKIE